MTKASWILVAGLLCAVTPLEARADRLQKYVIPQIAPPVMQRPVQTAPVYRDFEQQIRGLTWDEKKKLLDSFAERKRAATQNNRPAEAQYYEELSRILLSNM